MVKGKIDHYQLIREIGRGGMGEVYLARDLQLGRLVALKWVSADAMTGPEAKERFMQEARTTATFNHPNIVAIYGVGEFEDRPYVALEYLQGGTLRGRIQEGALGWREVVRIMQSIGQALDEAHRHQVLHLDLKPENVMIPRDGRLRVLDFGLSRQLSAKAAEARTTEQDTDEEATSDVWGTPPYISPEIWRGNGPLPASDIWALGVMAFEMLVGRKPWRNEGTFEMADEIMSNETVAALPQIEDMPRTLALLVQQCLEKDPDRRPTARLLWTTLDGDLVGRRPTGDQGNPFRGLLAFSERHADLFFGRDAEVWLAAERLRESPLLSIVGVSGAGKSSFVQAGLVPRLREGGPWRLISLRPGAHPFQALAQRLSVDHTRPMHVTQSDSDTGPAHAGSLALSTELRDSPNRLALKLWSMAEEIDQNVLLFVDQLEEAITLVEDEAERDAFLEAVCTAADDPSGRVRVVMTLRDDFLGRLASASQRVRDALSRVLVLQTPADESLRQIVTRPLVAVGYAFEDDSLVDAIVKEVAGEPAALPLVQFALGLLWDRRDRARGLITRAAYEGLGGVAGALATHADQTMVGLNETEVGWVREVMLRLVTPDGTRRVVSRERLLQGLPVGASAVLNRLIDSRMLALRRKSSEGEEGDLELAHESLVHSWHRLARWIDESHEELSFMYETEQAAVLWEKRGHRDTETWQGDALRDAERLLRRMGDRLPPHVKAFIQAGSQLQRERERNALAERATELAESARSALLRGDLVQARALVRNALETHDTNLARSLWWTLQRSSLIWKKAFGAVLYEVDYSPDGKSIAVGSLDTSVYLVDADTTHVRVLRGHDANVICVGYAPSGEHLASGSWSGQVCLWPLQTGHAPQARWLLGHTAMVTSVAFDPSGKVLASASADESVILWDVMSGERRATLKDHGASVTSVAFSQDGKWLASASADLKVRIWNVRLGIVEHELLMGDGIAPRAVVWTHDGKRLCVGGTDGMLRFYAIGDWSPSGEVRAHDSTVTKLRARGEYVVSTGSDQTTRVLLVGDDELPQACGTIRGLGTVFGAAFAPDAMRVATVTENTLRLWDVQRLSLGERAGVHTGGVESVAFSPSGKTIASGATDWSIRLWSTDSGECERVWHGHTAAVASLCFDKSGQRLVSAGWDGTTRLWDVQSGRQLLLWKSEGDRALFVRFSPDDKLVATANGDGKARIYDIATEQLVRVLPAHASECRCVAFSPDGTVLATSSYQDRVIRLWRLSDGVQVGELSGHHSGVSGIVFSPDGEVLISTSFDRAVRVWDVANRASQILGEHAARAFKCDISPVSGEIATTSADRTIRIWGGNGVRVLKGHAADVNQARYSSDGTLLCSGGDDMTVRVWRASDGRALWRGVFLARPSLEVLTHRGWRALGKERARVSERLRHHIERNARRATSDRQGELIAVASHIGSLELWQPLGEQPLNQASVIDPSRIIVSSDACLALAEQRITYLPREGAARTLLNGALALGGVPEKCWAALARRVLCLDHHGAVLSELPTDVGVTAVEPVGDRVVLGFENGFIELLSPLDDAASPSFEDTPASPVVRLVQGPMDTLAAGFANGAIAIWSLSTGIQLLRAEVHGPVQDLVLAHGGLVAMSELGDALVIDLSVMVQAYDTLLQEVRAEVPIRWEAGRALRV